VGKGEPFHDLGVPFFLALVLKGYEIYHKIIDIFIILYNTILYDIISY